MKTEDKIENHVEDNTENLETTQEIADETLEDYKTIQKRKRESLKNSLVTER